MVLALINTAFAQETAEAASAQWDVVADQLASKFPKLAVMLGDAKHDVLAFMGFPKAHRTQIASTNPLERVNAEIKRRTDVVGIFPNDAAIVRLIGALLLEQNDEWQLQRRYMQFEGLQVVSDNGFIASQPSLSSLDSYTTSWDTICGYWNELAHAHEV